MDFGSFFTSLGTSLVIFLILMLLFSCLSRKHSNNVIYYPNRIIKGMDPYDGMNLTRNPFAWIREAVSSSEADVLGVSGVDTAVYFVFLTSVLRILIFSGLLLLPVLLPIAATDHPIPVVIRTSNDTNGNTTTTVTFDDFDRLSMSHVRQRSPRLWAFLVAVYWVSFVAYWELWKAYNHVAKLRADAVMSAEVRPEQFAVLVRDIPKVSEGETVKEKVDRYFKEIYPETFYRSMVITDNKEVNRIYKKLEKYKKKLARAEVIYADSKADGTNPEGKRPTTKTGFLGLVGEKVDTIEYCNAKIKELVPALEAERKVTLRDKQERAAIIFFNNRVTAASASQTLHAMRVDSWTVMDAPEAGQLIWSNLGKKYFERQIRQFVIYSIVFFTIFFYIIPAGFVSALTTMENLERWLPFLRPVLRQSTVRSILEAYLPQLALLLFLAILPKFLLILSKFEGIPSESHAHRATSGKYFYFSALNVFLGVTLGQSLFSTLQQVNKEPASVVPLLGSSLPGSATFFITFVSIRFFVGYGFELSRIVPLIIFKLKKRFHCKTEAEIREAWAPDDLEYATRIPRDMLIVTICLCYSVIAPVIIPFGVVYFILGWLILRNQVLKVLVPRYETYGKIWPHIYQRIMAALILFQITMLGYFAIKGFLYAPFLIPLIVLSGIFIFVCTKKHYRSFQSTPLDVACQELKETPELEDIFWSFVPPSLRSDMADEEQPFEDALSRVSRTASAV